MKKYTISSFYKFIPLAHFETLKFPILDAMKKHQILGTILLAHEGINGSFAGIAEDMHDFYDYLRSHPGFEDLFFRETFDDMMPFEKAKVKLRKEIVTLGVPGTDPLTHSGIRVTPEEWNALIEDPEVVLIDTRNDYEVECGAFKGAINPNTEYFREFPQYVNEHLMDKKDKKIAMYCTGGIRCEKSTAYLKQLGFEKVYQLQGGIINYMQTIPEEKSLWQGKCFVFDERISID